MSDAGGHSGRNADRSAGNPAASPAPPAISGLLSTYVVVGTALVTISTYGRLVWWRGQTTPTRLVRFPLPPEFPGSARGTT